MGKMISKEKIGAKKRAVEKIMGYDKKITIKSNRWRAIAAICFTRSFQEIAKFSCAMEESGEEETEDVFILFPDVNGRFVPNQ